MLITLKFYQMSSEVLVKAFHFVCWAATIALVFYWVYVFNQNEDLVKVDFKTYYENKGDIFPMLSLCIKDPISDERMNAQKLTFNSSSYLRFLKGEESQPEMFAVDYKSIINPLSQYIEEDSYFYRNGTSWYIHVEYNKSYSRKSTNHSISLTHHLFISDRFYNCYGLSIPDDESIQTAYFRVNSSIFDSGVRHDHDLVTFLHYPNQLMTSANTYKFTWPHHRYPNESYIMRFRINGVEVLRRRQKRNRPCNEKWYHHDNEIIMEHVTDAGCRPPYLIWPKPVPLCSTDDQIKRAKFSLRTDGYGVLPPCKAMEKIYYTFDESSLDVNMFSWARKGVFWISVHLYDEQFKEITQTRYKIIF